LLGTDDLLSLCIASWIEIDLAENTAHPTDVFCRCVPFIVAGIRLDLARP
jgi:hypothetical protein